MGRRSEAAFPELRTMSLMQPTKDSIMYLTPWSFSSELRPEICFSKILCPVWCPEKTKEENLSLLLRLLWIKGD
jgi:hypothetical protein